MFAFFDFTRLHARGFQSRVRSAFAPRKPRHRALRVVLGVVGVVLLVGLLMFGLVIGAAMLLVGLTFKLLVRRGKPVARDPRIVDAEYRVVGKPLLSR